MSGVENWFHRFDGSPRATRSPARTRSCPVRSTKQVRATSLRWVYQHMVEEYARHHGHADLIRERIDGAVGD